MRSHVRTLFRSIALLASVGSMARAQTRDIVAFDAMVVSPIGALPPRTTDNGSPLPERTSGSISYGQWRYDIDDAIHNNVGLTYSHRLGNTGNSIAITGATLALSCQCSGWISGGVSLSSRVWNSTRRSEIAPRTSFHVGTQLMAGGARYLGEGTASAYSAAAVLDLGASLAVHGDSRLALSILPGVGGGHLWSRDLSGDGIRPVIGAALGWRFHRGIAVDLGARRISLAGGPTQYGLGVTWFKR